MALATTTTRIIRFVRRRMMKSFKQYLREIDLNPEYDEDEDNVIV